MVYKNNSELENKINLENKTKQFKFQFKPPPLWMSLIFFFLTELQRRYLPRTHRLCYLLLDALLSHVLRRHALSAISPACSPTVVLHILSLSIVKPWERCKQNEKKN